MKPLKGLFLLLITANLFAGCSGAFWGGTGSGVAATGAGYELRARQQMERIKGQLDRGEINQQEYDIRKDQIQQMSVAY